MAKAPFAAQWVQAGADIFQWGRKAAYWKGKKGWWASRQDVEGIKGPFRTPGSAQKWAEEPFREQHRLAQQKLRDEAQQALAERRAKVAARKAHAVELAQQHEAKELATWKGLPAEARQVQPGQVWAMRDPRFQLHQILVVEVKKKIAIVLARDSKATPWRGLAREPRTLSHLPRLYRLVGQAKVPGASKRKVAAESVSGRPKS
jgi:hypothetical protein